MRTDYCPISKEPCQSMCDMPCRRELVRELTSELVSALAATVDALDRNTSPFPLPIESTFAVLDTARSVLAKACG